MSSILTIILYHLTDGLISEPLPCQIAADFPYFRLIRSVRIESFFPQESCSSGPFILFPVTDLKRRVDFFRINAFLGKQCTDFLSAFQILTTPDEILRKRPSSR